MNKKKIVLIAGIIVAILLIGGGGLLWAVWQSNPKNNDASQGSSTGVHQYSNKQQLVDEVNKKYGEKDFKGAINLIEGQKNVQDVNMQLLLAGAYANSGNIAKAYEIYKKISDEGKLPDSEIVNFADMAERAGDFKGALEAYRKAKAHPPTSATPDDIATYDYKIAELEKRQ
jgi:pentatricopeptide repeat protein